MEFGIRWRQSHNARSVGGRSELEGVRRFPFNHRSIVRPSLKSAFLRQILAAVCLAAWLGVGSFVFAQVVFSEIHYHPVEEPAFSADGKPVLDLTNDVHEFLEIYNAGREPVDVSGWTIVGGIDYEFPSGSTLGPSQYKVVAKAPARLAAVSVYGLREADLAGPYAGQLSNRGETLRLRDRAQRTVDSVTYSATFPWAIGADALGADDEWTGLRRSDRQYRGRSLERVSFTHPSNDPANWIASPTAGEPSPGRPNLFTRPVPFPVVVGLGVYQAGDEQPLIRRGQPARIDVRFSAEEPQGSVELEYFVDDINSATEPRTNVVMTSSGGGAGGSVRFALDIPGLPDRSIVRYRIWALRGGAREVISPRGDDPFRWHAYFVTPVRSSSKPIYDCFISSASLARLNANITGSPRRVTAPDPPGLPRDSWNATEPAVMVADGVVHDIRMRHHGSRYNRGAGRNSFKWSFPRYQLFQGTDAIFETDKGSDFVNGHGLFINAGLPVSKVRYVDLYLNNNAVMQRLEQGEFNGDMLDRYHEDQQPLNPGSALESSGEIYKTVGTIDLNGEGPYGRGDGRKLSKAPNWTALQMYEWTYALQNHSWKGHTAFKTMIDAMWVARGDSPSAPNPNVDALRAFFTNYFDLDTTLTYLAVENWACPWDDTTQNHFLWQRSNGKWSMLPWDCDAWFGRGDNTPASASIFIGEVGDRSNNFRGPNFFKDGFLKAFRQEYKERLYLLNNTFLHPENITAMGFGSIRAFADARFTSVNQQCGLGTFQRPVKPVNRIPANASSWVPGTLFSTSPYSHTAVPASSHASSLWEIRAANGSYRTPVYKTTSTTNLISLAVPFRALTFGSNYYWRCTHIDSQGHPSIPSDETSFTFGVVSGVTTNIVSLVAINASTLWSYEGTGAVMPSTWKDPGFDDSKWPRGAALLALETAPLPEPIRTPLVLGQLSYFFRHRFTYEGPTTATLQLRQVVDDGAVYYLNGKELFRSRVSAQPLLQTSLSDQNVGDASYEGPFEVVATNLVAGQNVLAVEVHQSSAGSSDIVFGVSLEQVITQTTAASKVSINEVLASNVSAARNGTEYPDYVELHNASDSVVDLSGFSITDDLSVPDRYRFPAGATLAPRGHLVVWCDAAPTTPGLYAGFGLDASGQTLLLLGPSTNGPVVIDSIRFGPQVVDYSIGRIADGTGEWRLNRPSPGSANQEMSLGRPDRAIVNEWLADPGENGDDWLEIYNPEPLPIALGGWALADSVSAPDRSAIAPLTFIEGQGFQRFYADGEPSKGATHLDFKLSARGDSIVIFSTNGVVTHSVTFGPQEMGISQGRLPDGASRVVSFPISSSPGESNYLPVESVVINEVLSHSDPPFEDAIELQNMSGAPVDIGGWYLSDNDQAPRKFRIPSPTILPAGGFAVFYESQFNPVTSTTNAFALSSSRGDEVVLSQADVTGVLTGYRSMVRFGAAPSGVSFGRVNTVSGTDFALLSATSFGSEPFTTAEKFRLGKGGTNATPRIAGVVISEIMYHPPDITVEGTVKDNVDFEYIELHNTTGATFRMSNSAQPGAGWRLRGGVSFDFPRDLVLPPDGRLVLVSFDPSLDSLRRDAFRAHYSVPDDVPILGPIGRLGNEEDRVDLQSPELPLPSTPPDAGFLPYIVADHVRYADRAPWPPSADGLGAALHRVREDRYGNDAAHWASGPPSPGIGSGTPSDLDTDADGIPDAWEVRAGLDPKDPTDATQDRDGDGLVNRAEYRAGTDPNDRQSTLRLTARSLATSSAGELALSFAGVAGKIYVVEYRDQLTSGDWVTLAPRVAPVANGVVTMPISNRDLALQRYYRLRLP